MSPRQLLAYKSFLFNFFLVQGDIPDSFDGGTLNELSFIVLGEL